MDAVALQAALQSADHVQGLSSLLVMRHGALVGERYVGGASQADVLAVHSIAKSVCSLLVGQALARGSLPGIDAPLRQLIPEALARVPHSAAGEVTLAQILTGRSAIQFDWTRDTGELIGARDPTSHALGLLVGATAPAPWSYNDAAVSLLGPVLARAERMDLAQLAARDLFAPLGIERFFWRRDRQGQTTPFGGLALRTRDLMKLAKLMLDGGRWQGAQLVPEAWVRDSIRPHGPTFWRMSQLTDWGYGYLWFTGALHGRRVAYGLGYGGQFLFLVPELELAVCTAARQPRMEDLARQNGAIMALISRVVQTAV